MARILIYHILNLEYLLLWCQYLSYDVTNA